MLSSEKSLGFGFMKLFTQIWEIFGFFAWLARYEDVVYTGDYNPTCSDRPETIHLVFDEKTR